MWDNRNFVCSQKLLGEDGSVSWSVFMVKQQGLFSPKLRTMSSQNFAVELGIHSLTSWEKFFMHNPLGVKESDEHALEIAFHTSGPFWALVTWGFSTGRIDALSQGRNCIPSSHHQ